MDTVNNQPLPSFDLLQQLIAANVANEAKRGENQSGPKAIQAHLMQTLQSLLGQLAAAKTPSSKIVPFNPQASADSSGAPTNAQMQKSIGMLMTLLTQLQCDIAIYSNKNEQANSSVGQALMKESQAQLTHANEQLQTILKEGNSAEFWSIFGRIAQFVIGGTMSAIALACGQPELAALSLTFTALSATGGMEKITDGLSMALVAAGIPKKDAKVLADALIIVTAVAATAMMVGASPATEEAIGNDIELNNIGGNEDAPPLAENAENVEQNSKGILNKIPRRTRFALFAGLQAMASTNFGTDIMTLALSGMKDNGTQKIIASAVGMLISLMAALASAGIASSVCSESGAFKGDLSSLKQLPEVSPMRALLTLELIGGLGQFAGNTGNGVINGELAYTTYKEGQTKAFISELQSLIGMNAQLSSSQSRALISKMNTWTSELSSLSRRLNDTGAAIAHVLQA